MHPMPRSHLHETAHIFTQQKHSTLSLQTNRYQAKQPHTTKHHNAWSTYMAAAHIRNVIYKTKNTVSLSELSELQQRAHFHKITIVNNTSWHFPFTGADVKLG